MRRTMTERSRLLQHQRELLIQEERKSQGGRSEINDIGADEEDDYCPICYTNMVSTKDTEGTAKLSCGHRFCTECVV